MWDNPTNNKYMKSWATFLEEFVNYAGWVFLNDYTIFDFGAGLWHHIFEVLLEIDTFWGQGTPPGYVRH